MQAIGGKDGIALAAYPQVLIHMLLVPPHRHHFDAESLRDGFIIVAASQQFQYLSLPFAESNHFQCFFLWPCSLDKSGAF